MKHIVVIGIGYVGLVTATCFAEAGYAVTCLDIDSTKINNLSKGIIPIFEPGLEKLVQQNIAAKRLSFTTDYNEALKDASTAMIAVDTPTKPDNTCDTRNLEKCAHSLAQSITNSITVIVKSTVPVGTSNRIRSIIHAHIPSHGSSWTIDVVSNPEFLREGSAVFDFTHPDRVIIGVDSERAQAFMTELYKPFHYAPDALIFMDTQSSELTKYAANTMLACRISFMNWMSILCEKTGANIDAIRQGIGSDSRIGPAFLYAGTGFGGSCFPKDIKALQGMAKALGIPADLIDSIDSTNEAQKRVVGDKISAYFQNTQGLSIAIFGLAFKPNTDDIREAPSLTLIQHLLDHKIRIRVYDPIAMENMKKIFPPNDSLTYCTDPYICASGTNGIALMTDWDEFANLDFKKLQSSMAPNPLFVDGRNFYDGQTIMNAGFVYNSIGRPALEKPL